MQDTSGQTFKYNGNEYTFFAALHLAGNQDEVILDNASIESFEYSQQLNDIVTRGSLTYTDKYGQVDRLLQKQYIYCRIFFAKTKQQYDGEITSVQYDSSEMLDYNFVIENIAILGRVAQKNIKYKLSLASANIYNCMADIEYSNYGKDQMPVFDIFKDLIKIAGLKPDKDTFDRVKTDVKMNYITNGNDNIATAAKFLMHKLYYYGKDDALKFFWYDMNSDAIRLYSLKDRETSFGSYNIVLSMMKSMKEKMMSEDDIQLATVSRLPTSHVVESIQPYKYYTYSLSSNNFSCNDIDSDDIAEYYNERPSNKELLPKTQKLFKTDLPYHRKGAEWNNQCAIYNEGIEALVKHDALIVNDVGVVSRMPSSMVNVLIDRSQEGIEQNENDAYSTQDNLDDLMQRYMGLEGQWYVYKVHSFVDIQKRSFRQNLVLMKNFLMDFDVSK